MTPTNRLASAAALALTLAVAAPTLAGCASADRIELAGRVADPVTVVSAPALAVPAPIPAPAAARSRTTTVAAMAGMGQAQRVTAVPVRVGDRVAAGDVVARLDDRALSAAVEAARAARRTSLARIGVLEARLDDVADARSTIAENRGTVRDAIAKLTTTRADLADKLAAARRQLAALKALQRQISQPPPGSIPPTSAPPGGLPNPAQIAAGIAKLEAAIAQLEAGIAKIDAGLAQARSGLAKLADASATTADARTALRGVRSVAREAARAAAVGVTLAEAQRDLAVVRAPHSGTVTDAAQPGESVAPGAPLVRIRPDGASAVDAYLPPEYLGAVSVGDSAVVTIDSRPGERFEGTVTRIGVRAIYPPTWVSTTEVHLTRALPVRVTLSDSAVVLPPGTPADVTIQPGSAP